MAEENTIALTEVKDQTMQLKGSSIVRSTLTLIPQFSAGMLFVVIMGILELLIMIIISIYIALSYSQPMPPFPHPSLSSHNLVLILSPYINPGAMAPVPRIYSLACSDLAFPLPMHPMPRSLFPSLQYAKARSSPLAKSKPFKVH